MRVKIKGKIIEKNKPQKTNYSHEIYSMILNNLSVDNAKILHNSKGKVFKLLTFTNICINKDEDSKSDILHFYVSGNDDLIKDLIKHLEFNQICKIDDITLIIQKIELLSNLQKKNNNDTYKFKSKLIINIFKDNKNQLADDFEYIQERLKTNALKKAEILNINNNGEINFKIINPKISVERYKAGHIKSWKCQLEVKGDYELINLIYNVGVGENTATGHGFLWESKGA